MINAAQYSKFETLRDGLRVEIRALRPDDQDAMITAVGRTSAKSLYRRFFSQKRGFSEQEISVFRGVINSLDRFPRQWPKQAGRAAGPSVEGAGENAEDE